MHVRFKVVLTPEEDGGYSVMVPALPGCLSQGETKAEALANIREAIALHLDVLDDLALAPGDIVQEVVV